MLELLKHMGRTDVTVHGFRSTFKTWCDEETNFSNQAVEFCIAHMKPRKPIDVGLCWRNGSKSWKLGPRSP
jgi:hypothetical protein